MGGARYAEYGVNKSTGTRLLLSAPHQLGALVIGRLGIGDTPFRLVLAIVEETAQRSVQVNDVRRPAQLADRVHGELRDADVQRPHADCTGG